MFVSSFRTRLASQR